MKIKNSRIININKKVLKVQPPEFRSSKNVPDGLFNLIKNYEFSIITNWSNIMFCNSILYMDTL